MAGDGVGRGAARLTRHPAEEAYPALSPDGTTLAFSAAYDEQLAAAIRHLEDRIREEPMNDLPPPAFPRRAVE